MHAADERELGIVDIEPFGIQHRVVADVDQTISPSTSERAGPSSTIWSRRHSNETGLSAMLGIGAVLDGLVRRRAD